MLAWVRRGGSGSADDDVETEAEGRSLRAR